MRYKALFWIGLILSVMALAGCNMNIDAPQTPTVAASPTMDETAIARLFTPTPTYTPSDTPSPTETPTPTITDTATYTPTPTDTATGTASPTLTATNTPSPTATDTATPTATATNTALPTSTDTPRPTVTITSSPTATRTASPTLTLTNTPRPTATNTARPSATVTVRPIPTRTARPTVTATSTATRTATERPTNTPRPSLTPTIRVTVATPTRTPTATVAPLVIPTVTTGPTLTFTPFPTRTPTATSIEIETDGTVDPFAPTPTPTGSVPTPTPLPPTNTPAITVTSALPDGNGTFYDPNAPPTFGPLPIAPSGDTGPGGPVLPEQNAVVVSYAGQIVPLLVFSGGNFGDAALAQGTIFDVNSQGAVAAVGNDRWLYINGQPMIVSPASQYGVPDNLSFGDVVWSPDGQRVAFRVDAANPNEQNAIDSGVWIYEPATQQSWQIFRTGYEGQVAQLHEQRQPLTIHWAPNGTALVIKVTTPLGFANVFMPVGHNVNEFVNSIPYADATWAPDSASLIVSGVQWNGQTVVGRVALDAQWTYSEYANQLFNGLTMHAAIQLFDGRIVFLGGTTPETFALYVMQAAAGAQPVPLSIPVDGRVLSAEWNTERSAALVTVQTGTGNRLWIVRIDGTVQDVTPTIGSPATAHWR